MAPHATYDRLRRRFFWPRMPTDVQLWVNSCDKCHRMRAGETQPHGKLRSLWERRPFGQVGIDVVGPLPETERSNQYIIVLVDYSTRWVEAFPTRDNSVGTIARLLLDEWFPRYGAPHTLLSDQGSEFMNELVAAILELFRVRKIWTSAYHPQTNGLVERFNRTIKSLLGIYVQDHPKTWDQFLSAVLFAVRTTTHSSLQYAPFDLVHGREPRLPSDATLEGASSSANPPAAAAAHAVRRILEARERAAQSQAAAAANLQLRQRASARLHDRQRRHLVLRLGDRVRVATHMAELKPGFAKARWSKQLGTVAGRHKDNPDVYDVDYKGKRLVVNVDRLAPFDARLDITHQRKDAPVPAVPAPVRGTAAAAPAASSSVRTPSAPAGSMAAAPAVDRATTTATTTTTTPTTYQQDKQPQQVKHQHKQHREQHQSAARKRKRPQARKTPAEDVDGRASAATGKRPRRYTTTAPAAAAASAPPITTRRRR